MQESVTTFYLGSKDLLESSLANKKGEERKEREKVGKEEEEEGGGGARKIEKVERGDAEKGEESRRIHQVFRLSGMILSTLHEVCDSICPDEKNKGIVRVYNESREREIA